MRSRTGPIPRFVGWLPAILLTASCGAAVVDDGAPIAAEITLEHPVLEEVTRIRDLVPLDGTGDFWILNTGAPHLIKIDSDGTIIATFGEPGPGPDEIGYAMAIVGADDEWVELLDVVRRAVRRFDLTGKEVRSTPLPELQQRRVMLEMENTSYGAPFQTSFDGDHFLFLNYPSGLESTRGYWSARLDRVDRGSHRTTAVVDFSEWREDHEEELGEGLRLLPIPLWTACPDGSVAVYRPFADSIFVLGQAGSAIAVERAPRRLRDEEVMDFARGMLEIEISAGVIRAEDAEPILQAVFRQVRHEFGPWAPAYVALHCDHRNRFWLQRFSTEDSFVGFADTWDILSPDGAPLGAVTFPPRFRPMVFRESGVWGVRADEFDVNQVVRVGYPRGL